MNEKDLITLSRVNNLLGVRYAELNPIVWRDISVGMSLTEDFIREFKGYLDWSNICVYQHMTEPFLREVTDYLAWWVVSEYQCLSEDFIRDFKDKVDWDCICTYQHLSEDFMDDFEDRLDWSLICRYQKLSEDFIRRHEAQVRWAVIMKYQKLSDDFVKEFDDKTQGLEILRENSWLYKTTKEKKQAVIDTGLYECHDDYFIAYKGIREDRYSAYNFQYKYEKGGVYGTWCDCSNNYDSFGFSAWTKDDAEDYCSQLVVRVKVRYEDVGRVVHNGGKIRCFKLEVLD